MSLLAFRKVSFRYRDREQPVLRSLSLDVPEGAVFAILGPNGAGKTTLLYLALGWLRAQYGRILLAGRELSTYSPRQRGRWMSLVPQGEHIPFEYSLLEYVMLGRNPHLKALAVPGQRDIEIALQVLGQVGLKSRHSRSILRLSAGERQLAMIARALAQRPRILLMDEPTSHLDPGNKSRVLGILRRLAEKRITILFTTHEPEVATRLASHLVFLKNGRLLRAAELSQALRPETFRAAYGLPAKIVEIEGRKIVLLD